MATRQVRRLAAAALLFGAAAAGRATTMIPAPVLTEAQAKTPQRLAFGTLFDVALTGPSGNGYAWRATMTEGFAMLDAPFAPQASGVPGAPLTQTFRFRPTAKGRHVLAFSYDRPWKGGEKGARRVRFTIDVQ